MTAQVVVLDLGEVLVRWDPFPAIAAGVGEAEAQRFLTEFDFGTWNHLQDAGRTWDDANAWLGEHDPAWLPHGRAYREHFGHSLVGLVPGTSELIEALDGAGVPLYALTNWAADTYPVAVERYDVLGRFRDVVVSGEVGLAKPDAAIYELTAARIGHPAASIFFTDDRPANVDAARAAGWDAEVFTDAAALAVQLRERGLLPD